MHRFGNARGVTRLVGVAARFAIRFPWMKESCCPPPDASPPLILIRLRARCTVEIE